MLLFIVPYLFLLVGIPGLMTIPFYFFNKYLQRVLRPRESGKQLALYFLVVIISAFVYITIGLYAIVKIIKWLG